MLSITVMWSYKSAVLQGLDAEPILGPQDYSEGLVIHDDVDTAEALRQPQNAW